MKTILFLVILLVSFFTMDSVFSDYFNNRNSLIGGKAAMMGGAYTAISDDISGGYYNPAGLAEMKEFSVTMTSSIYSYQSYKQNISSGGTNFAVKLSKFNPVPTVFGISLPLSKDLMLTVSMFELDRFRFSSTTLVTSTSNLKIRVENESYLIGPSIAYKLSAKLSVGLSIFYHLFQGESESTLNIDLGGGNRSITNSRKETTSGGIAPIIGLKLRLLKDFMLGLSYGMQTIHTNGTTKFNETTVDTFGTNTNTQGETKGDIRLPHRINFGVAYERKKDFTISFDFIYYFKLDYSSPNDPMANSSDPNRHLERAHFDISLGGELFVLQNWSLRFGAYTNTSSAPSNNASERVNIYGGTFGVGHYNKNIVSGAGVNVSYGSSTSKTSGNGDSGSWKRLQISIIISSGAKF